MPRPAPLASALLALICWAAPAHADPHELRIPLHDGKVNVADMSPTLCRELHLPPVVRIQGRNRGRTMLQPIGDRLERDGYQVAYFCYPSDQPIADSADFLSRQLHTLRDVFPDLKVDIVGHSMGGLVAREYVE